MLDFSDRTRTGISILTSAADSWDCIWEKKQEWSWKMGIMKLETFCPTDPFPILAPYSQWKYTKVSFSRFLDFTIALYIYRTK